MSTALAAMEARASAAVHVSNLSFGPMERGQPVIRIDRLDIPQRSVVSILGRSGCGKTTFLSLVGGLYRPNREATIEVFGRSVKHAVSSGDVILSFQVPVLMSWRTAHNNVRLATELKGKTVETETIDRALAYVGLAKARDLYPGNLSSGMRSRVAVAQALVSGANLLLMDEVFGTLDEATRVEMNLMLRDLHTKHLQSTIIFVTHSIDEALLLGDRVLVFKPLRCMDCQSIRRDLSITLPERTKGARYDDAFKNYKKEIEALFDEDPQ